MTCSLFLNVYILYSLYSQSTKNMRDLSNCVHDLHLTFKRIGKVFTVRCVASSFRAVSAVWHSFPALAQHFQNASKDETRQSTEKAWFQGLLSKLCATSFVKNLALTADVLNELKNLSETLQNRSTTLPKAQNLLTVYIRRIENLVCCFFGRAFNFGSTCRSNVVSGSAIERR